MGGSKTQEIRNPAPGFLISSVFGPNPYQISTLHPLPSGEFRNSRRFATQLSWAHKNQEIKNSAPGFRISWVLGGRNTGNKKSSPVFSLFLVVIHIKSSTLHPLPSGEFRNSRRFAAEIRSPSKRPDIKSALLLLAFGRIPKLSPMRCRNPNIKSSPLLLAFGRAPKLSPICCRNPKPVHLGFR